MEYIKNSQFKLEYDKLYTGSKEESPYELLRDILVNRLHSYTDSKCTRLHCEGIRYRSITDLYVMLNTNSKFSTPYDQLIIYIMDLIKEYANSPNNFTIVYCTRINKPVVKNGVRNSKQSLISSYSMKGYLHKVGQDGVSLSYINSIEENFRNV